MRAGVLGGMAPYSAFWPGAVVLSKGNLKASGLSHWQVTTPRLAAAAG